MKKLFIVAGELSGDKLGKWYLEQQRTRYQNYHIEAVGGDFLKSAGAHIHQRFETLNVTGIIEIIKKLPQIFKNLRRLSFYILENEFEEVVLIDFPGFNLRLAKKLKEKNKHLRITYFCPPQLWCWGEWRMKNLKKFCDEVIVLYPFEVDWYKKRGLQASWIGSPVLERLQPYIQSGAEKKNSIVVLPGSRHAEIENMFSIFADIMKKFLEDYPACSLVLPLARSLKPTFLEEKIEQYGLRAHRQRIRLVIDEQEKYQAMASSCLAISKPGTITLELALLGVPTVVLFKTSWINYLLAWPFVKVQHMSLPNLLLGKEVFKEFIQQDCKAALITAYAKNIYESFLSQGSLYQEQRKSLDELRETLTKK